MINQLWTNEQIDDVAENYAKRITKDLDGRLNSTKRAYKKALHEKKLELYKVNDEIRTKYIWSVQKSVCSEFNALKLAINGTITYLKTTTLHPHGEKQNMVYVAFVEDANLIPFDYEQVPVIWDNVTIDLYEDRYSNNVIKRISKAVIVSLYRGHEGFIFHVYKN